VKQGNALAFTATFGRRAIASNRSSPRNASSSVAAGQREVVHYGVEARMAFGDTIDQVHHGMGDQHHAGAFRFSPNQSVRPSVSGAM
jgi:hypothetical protein